MPKQTAYFRFGSVEQARGSKNLQTGELIKAVNVRQTSKRGTYSKRLPFTRTAMTATGGTLGAAMESVGPGSGNAMLLRDTSDQSWSQGTTGNTWAYRGKIARPFVDWQQSMPLNLTSIKVKTAATATQLWQFVEDVGNGYWYYSAFDIATGATLVPMTKVTAINAGALLDGFGIACAYDGTNVWVFELSSTTAGAGRVESYKFDPANPTTAPVLATYKSSTLETYSSKKPWIDAAYLPGLNKVAVIYWGATVHSGSTPKRFVGYLDPATGAEAASPTAVSYGDIYSLAGRIATQTAASTYWYYVTIGGSAFTNYSNKVTSATLAEASTDLGSYETSSPYFREATAYVDASTGYVHVYVENNLAAAATYNYTIDHTVVNGASVTTTAGWVRGSKIASAPFLMGTSWYILTGFDDTGAVSAGTQKTLHLRSIDGTVIAQAAFGQCGNFWATRVQTYSATKFLCGMVLQSPVGAYQSPGVVTIESENAHAYSLPAYLGGNAYAPGGLASTFGTGDDVKELTPLLYPCTLSQTGGSGTGTIAIAALFSYTDYDGTLYRSSPLILTATILNNATATISTLRHGPNKANARIELYSAVSGGQLVYQTSIANDPTVDTLTWTVTKTTGGETLYTAGGALSAAPLPPVQTMGTWRNRVFAARKNVIWFSQELSEGFGPRFNEVLTVTWPECTGDITAICPIDYNFCAIFSADKVAVISGPGPDGIGQGNYSVQNLPFNLGCNNPKSVVNGPGGAYFQDTATGRLFVATPSLQISEVGGGLRDLLSVGNVLGSAWAAAEKCMLFVYASGLLVLDTGNPTESQPFGQCYVWTTSSIGASGAIMASSTGPSFITSSGHVMAQATPASGYVQDTNNAGTAVDYSMELWTGRIQPAGALGDCCFSRIALQATKKPQNDGLGSDVTTDFTLYVQTSIDGATYTGASQRFSEVPAASALLEFVHRPAGCARTDGVFIKIYETIASGKNTWSFDFDSIAIEFIPRGRIKALNSGSIY